MPASGLRQIATAAKHLDAASAFFERKESEIMNEDEVAVSFSKSFIREKVAFPSGDGTTYERYIIEMPDEEGDSHDIRRTFTVPVSYLHTDRKHEYIKYTYLKKDKLYRVMRALYDSDYRTRRVESDEQMTGKQIAAVFERYRDRKRKEFEAKMAAEENGEE